MEEAAAAEQPVQIEGGDESTLSPTLAMQTGRGGSPDGVAVQIDDKEGDDFARGAAGGSFASEA